MTHELYEKISRLQWLFQKQHLKSRASAGPVADATRGQGRILAFLKIKDGISTKDLSYLLGIRISSLNELLAKLEKTGYITREPSETDKRVMLIHLTEKGRQEEEDPDGGDIFSCLSPEEQAAFGEYLDRIMAALEKDLGIDDERDNMFDWMEAARKRLGAEHFDELMSMRGRLHGMRGGFGGCVHEPGRDGHGRIRHGFGSDRRGPVPGDIAETNRPGPGCGGPDPKDRDGRPLA